MLHGTCMFFFSLEYDGLVAILGDARNKRCLDLSFLPTNSTMFTVAAEHYKVADTLVYRSTWSQSFSLMGQTDMTGIYDVFLQRGHAACVGLQIGIRDPPSDFGNLRSAPRQRSVQLLCDGAKWESIDRYEESWSTDFVRRALDLFIWIMNSVQQIYLPYQSAASFILPAITFKMALAYGVRFSVASPRRITFRIAIGVLVT